MDTEAGRSWIEEYVACYDVVDCAELEIDRAYLIKEANLPRSIYKFRGVRDYSLGNLRDGTIWLNSPSKYNDPYDCAATISANEIAQSAFSDLPDELFIPLKGILSDEEIAAARAAEDPLSNIMTLVLSRDQKFPPGDIPKMIEALRNATAHVLQPHLQRNIDTYRNTIKMCSFSETNDILLMWSHYAENHAGFCIEYEVKALEPFIRRMLFPVIYAPKRFDTTKYHKSLRIDLEGYNNLYGVLQALYKAPEWAYEREWRFVLGHGLMKTEQNYDFGKAKRVYLGALIDDDRKKKVMDVCQSLAIPVSQMRLSATEYRMVVEPNNREPTRPPEPSGPDA